MAQLGRTRNGYGTLADAVHEAENDLNRGLHQLVESTGRTLSCGTGDQTEKERTDSDAALTFLDRIQSEEDSP